MDELKIIGTIQTTSKHFKTVDEFNLYYVKHKADMEGMTTQKLNKSFTIDGYRITKINTRDADGKRIKGEICLKPIKESNETTTQESTEMLKYEELNEKIQILTETVNKIIEHINKA